MLSVDVSIDKIDNVGVKTREGMTKYFEKGADRGFAEAMDRAPVDRGELMRNMFSPTREKGEIKWGVRDTPYARPMEFGTEPFYPPLEPLLEWSQRVAGDTGLGYYVARVKIPEEGIDAQPYARPGRDAQIRWYRSHSPSDFVDRELR